MQGPPDARQHRGPAGLPQEGDAPEDGGGRRRCFAHEVSSSHQDSILKIVIQMKTAVLKDPTKAKDSIYHCICNFIYVLYLSLGWLIFGQLSHRKL